MGTSTEDSFAIPDRAERKKITATKKTSVREIITKAVCGSAQKSFLYCCEIEFDQEFIPSQILGTSITAFTIHPVSVKSFDLQKPSVTVSGSFDVNVWFSFNNGKDTEVAREVVEFSEMMEIEDFDPAALNEMEGRAVLTKTPQYKGAVIQNNNTIKVDIEMGIYAEVISETKIRVQCYKSEYEEDS